MVINIQRPPQAVSTAAGVLPFLSQTRGVSLAVSCLWPSAFYRSRSSDLSRCADGLYGEGQLCGVHFGYGYGQCHWPGHFLLSRITRRGALLELSLSITLAFSSPCHDGRWQSIICMMHESSLSEMRDIPLCSLAEGGTVS